MMETDAYNTPVNEDISWHPHISHSDYSKLNKKVE